MPDNQIPQADFQGSRRTVYRLRGNAARAVKGTHHRVGRCGRVRIADAVTVHVKDGRAHFSGIETCGSIWTCPVCATKISAKRRLEVGTAITGHWGAGGEVYMMAFTAAHYRGQGLKSLKGRITRAWSKLKAGAPWKRIKERFGLSGDIRALEVTWTTANGWHPHIHVLLFIDRRLSDVDRIKLQAWLFGRWNAIVMREGAPPCNHRLFRLERCATPEAAGEYVAKWGAEYEMTHLHSKRAKGGGMSPWDMLDLIGRGGDHARRLFREFADAMKGARHLTWSQGLKARYGVDEVTDEEAAEEDGAAPIALTVAGKDFDVIHHKGRAVSILEAAEEGGQPAVIALVEALTGGRRTQEALDRRASYFDGLPPMPPLSLRAAADPHGLFQPLSLRNDDGENGACVGAM
jgi:hypothetical protein